MRRLYYHARTIAFPTGRIPAGTCLTTSPGAALAYLEGEPGFLYTVRVLPILTHSDEDDLIERGLRVGVPRHSRPFEAADHLKVRKGLTADGFDAVAYEDETPDTQRPHDCLLILVDGVAVVEEVEEIE
jgi:hypothetical protein